MPFSFARRKELQRFRGEYSDKREEKGYPTAERIVEAVWLTRYERPVCFWLKFFFCFGYFFFCSLPIQPHFLTIPLYWRLRMNYVN